VKAKAEASGTRIILAGMANMGEISSAGLRISFSYVVMHIEAWYGKC
jgi:hypothetical protein